MAAIRDVSSSASMSFDFDAAVASMSDAVLACRSLAAVRESLLARLAARS
jgi:hypothetical protein